MMEHSLFRQRGTRFAIGLAAGLACSQALVMGWQLLAPVAAIMLPPLVGLTELVFTNLGGSLLPFLLVIGFYYYQLQRLREDLNLPLPALDRIVRREQLLDLAATLCFGIGVIWTAIGMRAALLYGLGATQSMAQDGGFSILQRMVEGGILIALSTTIVGGVGSYVMRLTKSLLVGPALNKLYISHGSQPLDEGLEILLRIDTALAAIKQRTGEACP